MPKTAKAEPRPVGRPTKYGPHIIKAIQAMPPSTYTKIALALDINKATLYEWLKEYPEFTDAVEKCRGQLVGVYEDIMLRNAQEGGGNATAGIFMLKNLAPDDYRDRREYNVETRTIVELDFMGYDEDELDAIEGEYEEVEE